MSTTPITSRSSETQSIHPSVHVALQLQRLIAEQQTEHQTEQQFSPNDFDSPPSRQWTPLSSRVSNSLSQQTPAQPVDRLDRLLADMETVIATSPNPPLSHHQSSLGSSPQPPSPSPPECWELPSLETRFQPIHTGPHSRPLRPCLKTRSTSISSSVSVSDDTHSSASDSDSASSHSQFSDPPFEALELPPNPLDIDDERAVRVRFDDDTVEEFLTWSRESYDRKGPMPITKLNLREVIELKLIKEELGISPSSVAISPSSASISPSSASISPSSSSSTTSVSPSTTTLLPAFDTRV
ncbi:hypothetical protein VP01_1614g2 [Puccinia sorghi]|uniref:Uncharacterized protein n=1 Tax=Puccinia sorghi TaxID=27349 RepID=A0A0L6VH32_9BASI|nr:hypothetical protein VP01_1614g2 [Puccinia sorghi]